MSKKKLIADILITDERDSQEPENGIEPKEAFRLNRKKSIEKQCKNIILPPEVLDELSVTLLDDENVLKALPGSFRNEAGTLVATEKRLLFIDKRQKEIYNKVRQFFCSGVID